MEFKSLNCVVLLYCVECISALVRVWLACVMCCSVLCCAVQAFVNVDKKRKYSRSPSGCGVCVCVYFVFSNTAKDVQRDNELKITLEKYICPSIDFHENKTSLTIYSNDSSEKSICLNIYFIYRHTLDTHTHTQRKLSSFFFFLFSSIFFLFYFCLVLLFFVPHFVFNAQLFTYNSSKF